MVLKVIIFKDGKGGREVVSIYMPVAGTATSRDWVGGQRRRRRESRQRTCECSKGEKNTEVILVAGEFLVPLKSYENSSFLKLLGTLGRRQRGRCFGQIVEVEWAERQGERALKMDLSEFRAKGAAILWELRNLEGLFSVSWLALVRIPLCLSPFLYGYVGIFTFSLVCIPTM